MERKMNDSPQGDYRYIELDTDLLSTPFRIQTNWHVITGAPSCGKTTLIDQLAKEGFQTVPESAHEYLETEMASGRTIQEILCDRVKLQRILIELQDKVEQGLKPNDLIFLDRALPDSLAFNRYFGIHPDKLLKDCFQHRYDSVFILDPLPYHADGIRDYDAPLVDYLDEWLERDYCSLGYPIVRVPVLPPPERLAFVLERLSEGGYI
jgi:predicted ATPase